MDRRRQTWSDQCTRFGRNAAHGRRVGRRRRGARLRAPAVCHRQLWRPQGALHHVRQRPAADLCAVDLGLLHVLDILRLGRHRDPQRAGVPDDLYRADPGLRPRLSAAAADHTPGQERAHHLGRRLHRCALRQEPAGGRRRRDHRRRRHRPLYRAAAEGSVAVGHHADLASQPENRRDRPVLLRRHHLDDRHRHGDLRLGLRDPAYRCDGAPGRPDAGHCRRGGGQAGRLPRRRHMGHLLALRRARRPVRRHGRRPQGGGRDVRRAVGRQLGGDDAAVRHRRHPAAAPVPRHGDGKQLQRRAAPCDLAVPALSRGDQPVRGADRGRRHDHAGPGDQPRLLRARPAAGRQSSVAGADRLHRRLVGGHRHGHRRQRRARHHDLQRPGDAAGAAPLQRGRDHRLAWRGHEPDPAADAAGGDLRHAAARLCLLPGGRRHRGADFHRSAVLRRHRAVRPGLLRRPRLAARHRARRHRRHADRLRHLGLHAAAADLRAVRADPGDLDRERPLRHLAAAAAGAVLACLRSAHPWRVLEPCGQYHRLYRRLAVAHARAGREAAGQHLRAIGTVADAGPAPVAHVRHGRRPQVHHRPLSRRGTDRALVPELCPRARARFRPQRHRGRAGAAVFRTAAGQRHRRGLLAAGAVAAGQAPRSQRQGRAEAAGRCHGGDPVQPRPAADRARPGAPGDLGLRPRPSADLLEPAIPRAARPAGGIRPGRNAARRHYPLQRQARRAGQRSGGGDRR